MENKAMHAALVNWYNRKAFTHSYVFGYAFGGVVYAAKVEKADNLLPFITCVESASAKNGGGYALKYKPNKTIWIAICAAATEVLPICSVDYLEELNKNSKHNRGQLFEELVANAFGGELNTCANAKFTDAGDLTINGIAYQVKYSKATFTNEATMQRMG